MRLSKNSASVTLVLGDITEFTSDAVVNPANKYLVMGGGVAGAIKKKGGEEIELEARRYAPIEIGEAVVTSAGGLKCRAVIHAPTVESPGGRSTRNYVYRATLAALKVARELGFKSIAFPLMDAGVGVRVSLGLMFFDVKPSTLGFTALGIPFHRDPCHRAPPTRGDPSSQLLLHCFLWVIAVRKPPHPGPPSKHASLRSPH